MPEIAAGTVLAGKFRVERCLGTGGMGAVYAIRHELTRHRRALKLLHPEHGARADLVRRFLAEASAAGRAGSPHLVETFDAGTLPSGEPYLVMELLEGLTFGELLEREGPLDPGLACELIAQASEGMAAAHAAGIVHRDLKPDNLFIVQRGESPFVKVLDFGISKFTTESLIQTGATQDGALFGTPAYMAPEQFRNAKDADPGSDVFALGAVLFECLGGQPPYGAPSVHAIAARLMTGQCTQLAELRSDLDPALVALVHRAIAADPAQRILSAHALVAALAPFRSSSASALSALRRAATELKERAVAPVPSEPISLPLQRRRATLIVCACLALGLLALVIGWAQRGPEQAKTAKRVLVPLPPTLPPAPPAAAGTPGTGAAALPEESARVAPGGPSAPSAAPAGGRQGRSAPAARAGHASQKSTDDAPDAGVRSSRARQLKLSERNPFR